MKVQTVNTSFRKTVDYRTCRLERRSTRHDQTVLKNISKTSKRMTPQLKLQIFDSFNHIYIIWFLCNFKLACDTIGIHEGPAIWFFNFFVKKSASIALKTRLASKHKSQTWMPSVVKTTKLSLYPQVVNYLFQTYGTDENIADTEDAITAFSLPSNKTLFQYAYELVA